MLGHRPDAEATNRALRALSDACRRRLLFELHEGGDSGAGTEIDYSELPLFQPERRRRRLRHVHLPKLEAYGYIEWDEAANTVDRGPQWAEIEPLLELIYSHLYELPAFLQGKPSDGSGTKP